MDKMLCSVFGIQPGDRFTMFKCVEVLQESPELLDKLEGVDRNQLAVLAVACQFRLEAEREAYYSSLRGYRRERRQKLIQSSGNFRTVRQGFRKRIASLRHLLSWLKTKSQFNHQPITDLEKCNEDLQQAYPLLGCDNPA
jgi:hypothetical protein